VFGSITQTFGEIPARSVKRGVVVPDQTQKATMVADWSSAPELIESADATRTSNSNISRLRHNIHQVAACCHDPPTRLSRELMYIPSAGAARSNERYGPFVPGGDGWPGQAVVLRRLTSRQFKRNLFLKATSACRLFQSLSVPR